jgi:hypothetical protein
MKTPEFRVTTKVAGVGPPPCTFSQLAAVSVEVDALTLNAGPLEVIVSGMIAGGSGWPF